MAITDADIYEILENDVRNDTSEIGREDLLFSSRIFDSFALVTLTMEIERRAGIRVAPDDVNLTNFDSIGRMIAYVSKVRA